MGADEGRCKGHSRLALSMSVVFPAAHKYNHESGTYDTSDEVTSGGDIGVQVPIYPVVWVRRSEL